MEKEDQVEKIRKVFKIHNEAMPGDQCSLLSVGEAMTLFSVIDAAREENKRLMEELLEAREKIYQLKRADLLMKSPPPETSWCGCEVPKGYRCPVHDGP